jgi:hypothetical protein
LGLSFAGSLPTVVQKFATTTKQQHTDHKEAFSAAVRALGVKAQTEPDPVLLAVVNKAKPGLTGPGPLVDLAITLEIGATETYLAYVGALSDKSARVTFAQTMKSQHEQHAQAWNAVLSGAGKPAVTGVDKTVKDAVVDPAFAKVKDAAGLAALALELENVAAATYLEAISVVTVPVGIKTAATIEPVELQHVAILDFVLGKYPVPDTLTKMDGARPVTDVIA